MSGMNKKMGMRAFGLLSLLLTANAVHAKTFTVTNTGNEGPGSLRDALMQANRCDKPATIEFALGPADAGFDCHAKSWNIHLTDELPVITVPVVIDGYSQPGSCKNRAAIDQENNAHIAVVLCCGAPVSVTNDEGCPAAGLTFGPGSDGSKVSGLAINGFERGIDIQSNKVHVSGMFLGVYTDGVTSNANESSIVVNSSATGTVIGGCKPKHRNLIGGSSQGEESTYKGAFQLLGAITNLGNRTTIQGTTINLTRTGNALITTEAQRGIVSLGNDGLLIGGPRTGERVIVAGNYDANIHLDSTSNDTLHNVFSGLALDGKQALGGGVGLRMLNNQGEPAAAALEEGYLHAILESVFSGNGQSGVVLGQDDADLPVDNTLIRKSFMGTDVTGDNKVPNGEHGIHIPFATNTVIENTVLCYNKGNGFCQTGGSTLLAESNTSFNDLGGINLPKLGYPGGDGAFQLTRVAGIKNGNNAISTPHFTVEQF